MFFCGHGSQPIRDVEAESVETVMDSKLHKTLTTSHSVPNGLAWTVILLAISLVGLSVFPSHHG